MCNLWQQWETNTFPIKVSSSQSVPGYLPPPPTRSPTSTSVLMLMALSRTLRWPLGWPLINKSLSLWPVLSTEPLPAAFTLLWSHPMGSPLNHKVLEDGVCDWFSSNLHDQEGPTEVCVMNLGHLCRTSVLGLPGNLHASPNSTKSQWEATPRVFSGEDFQGSELRRKLKIK